MRAGIPRGFKPALYDRGAVTAPGDLGVLQPDLVGDLLGSLTEHAILDHGAARKGSNLPPLQNIEQLGVTSRVNTQADLASLAGRDGQNR